MNPTAPPITSDEAAALKWRGRRKTHSAAATLASPHTIATGGARAPQRSRSIPRPERAAASRPLRATHHASSRRSMAVIETVREPDLGGGLFPPVGGSLGSPGIGSPLLGAMTLTRALPARRRYKRVGVRVVQIRGA